MASNKTAADDAASSSSSSDDDSDDEFLTISGSGAAGNKRGHHRGGGDHHQHGGAGAGAAAVDREALVRKKLLENFYGKSSVAAATAAAAAAAAAAGVPSNSSFDSATSDDDDDDDDDTDGSAAGGSPSQRKRRASQRRRNNNNKQGNSDDVDSPDFDADAHTRRHVMNASVHTLLETEERLALQVRTLDSTMQTLVYENYSRFIDATDAIRSIGVNVQANEDGIGRLTAGMHAIDEQSRSIEDALGSLRDQVAEKIRVKRLLTRLDSLLRLPATLQDLILAGKYRTATRSYLSASSILSKHSAGFESLKSIETECNTILMRMKAELKRKLFHWGGNQFTSSGSGFDDDDDAGVVVSAIAAGSAAPDPPKNMAEIFECAGTLFILLQDKKSRAAAAAAAADNNEDAGAAVVEEEEEDDLTTGELQSMALSASMRLLDRLLDSHLIEVQEARFATSGGFGFDPATSPPTAPSQQKAALSTSSSLVDPSAMQAANPNNKESGEAFIPGEVLDAILEVATLFGISFGTAGGDGGGASSGHLVDFVTESFTSFLIHVRSILLEETAQLISSTGPAGLGDETQQQVNAEATAEDEGENEAADAAYEAISGALAILIQSVQNLASGLALPEVGLAAELAANLVEQAVNLTESMVRRRVDQKFHDLRLSVVRDCLIPFASRVVAERDQAAQNPEKPGLPQIVQIANSTLSDCLQLVDDTIRSIFSGGMESDSGASPDLPILKSAVQASTARFAMWLASALEILAGGESSVASHVIEAPVFEEGNDGFHTGDTKHDTSRLTGSMDLRDDVSELPDDGDDAIMDLVDAAIVELRSDGEGGARTIHSDFVLAISEMCRLAERSIENGITQSITAHVGGGKKKGKKGLFPSNELSPMKAQGEHDSEISARFALASSRILVLYATNRGAEAASMLCANLSELATTQGSALTGPRDEAVAALEVAKTTAIECAGIFGWEKRAGPVEAATDNDVFSPMSATSAYGRMTGLQLDVERMFKEKVPIYPHPSVNVDPSRDSIMFLLFKVAFRSLFEHSRLETFSADGYRQLLIDTEFLKCLLSHYIGSDYALDGGTKACSALQNLLNDTMSVVAERCVDEGCTEDDDLSRESRGTVRSFLSNVAGSEVAGKFIIEEE